MHELCGFLFHDVDPITEKGGEKGKRAGVVGYNGGPIARDDGGWKSGRRLSRYTARRSRDHSGDSTRLDLIAAASGSTRCK